MLQVSQTQTELGNDWYLDRVEVTGPEGVCWVFPCDDWFGRTEDDESIGEQKAIKHSGRDLLHPSCIADLVSRPHVLLRRCIWPSVS